MRILAITCSVFLLPLLFGEAAAQNGSVATQTVTVEVKPITKITISGSPEALVINSGVAWPELTSVDDNSTRYSITTNLENTKIVASISDRMPAGTKLLISLGSVKGVSAGTVDLSDATEPVSVVAGIGRGNDPAQPIRYTFAADASVGTIESDSRVVTLTLTD